MSIGSTPQKSHNWVAGPGRPKGSKSAKYITIASMTEAIQQKLGCSFQEATAELLADARDRYYEETDRKLFPQLVMSLANKMVESPKQEVEVTSQVAEMSDEELEAQAKILSQRFTGGHQLNG